MSKGLAIIYDRASREEQKDNYSRADAARLSELAERYGYRWELRREIKSGETIADRPVMKQILEEIAHGKVRAIICQDFTRLSRDQDQIDGRIIKQICRDNDCLVITPEKVYDFSLDADDDLADINFFLAKIQKRQNVKALVRGLCEKARQGKWTGGHVRLGYDLVYNEPTDGSRPVGELRINPEEAELVRLIFKLTIETNATSAARILNAQGKRLPVKSKKLQEKYNRTERLFTPTDVIRIVSDPIYAGFMVWGRKCDSPFTKGFEPQMVHRPDLQIVPIKTFELCQRLLKERSKVPPRIARGEFPFSYILKCANCGGHMSGYRKKDRRYGKVVERRAYRCGVRVRFGKAKCPRGQSLSENIVAMAVIPLVAELITNTLNFHEVIVQAAKEYDRTEVEGTLESNIKAEIVQIEAAMKRLVDAIAEGVITHKQAKDKNQELLERRRRLQRELANLARKDEIRQELREAIAVLEGDVEGILWRLLEERPQVLARILRLLFVPHSVVVQGEGASQRRTGRVVEFQLTPEASALAEFDSTRWSEWEIVEESDEHEKLDAQTVEWRVTVPADGEAEVTYTVRYRW